MCTLRRQLLASNFCLSTDAPTPSWTPHAQFCLHAYRKDQAIQNGWSGGGGGGDQWLPLRRLLHPHEEDDLHRPGCLRCHLTSGSHVPRAKSLFCLLQVWRIRSILADIQCAQTSRFTMSLTLSPLSLILEYTITDVSHSRLKLSVNVLYLSAQKQYNLLGGTNISVTNCRH